MSGLANFAARLASALGRPGLRTGLAALSAAVAPALACAQEQPTQVDTTVVTAKAVPAAISHELSDPTYLPAPGELFGETEASYDLLTSDRYTGAGAFAGHDRGDTTAVLQRFSYGVIRDFAVAAAISAGSESIRDDPARGARRLSRRDGFAEPIFSATYRAIRQGGFPVTLDLSAAYIPDLISQRAASGVSQGSLAQGGDVTRLTAAAARVNAYETVQGFVRVDHYGNADREDASGGESDTAAYWSPSVGLNTETRFTQRIALNLDASYVFDRTTAIHYVHQDLNTAVDEGSAALLTAGFVYRVIPLRLDAELIYGHTFYGRVSTDDIDDPARRSFAERSEDRVGLELRYRLR